MKNIKKRKKIFWWKIFKSSRNIMNEKPQSELGEKTSEIFYSGKNTKNTEIIKRFLIQN